MSSQNFVIKHGLTVNPGEISTTSATVFLFDTVATTVNAFRDATSITIGATTGTTTIRNDLTVLGDFIVNGTQNIIGETIYTGDTTFEGDIAVNGGDITSTASTFNFVNDTVQTLNMGGTATSINIGGAATVTNFAGDVNIGGSITVAENATVTADFSSNNATITGNLVVNGSTTLGNDPADTTTIEGFTTIITPTTLVASNPAVDAFLIKTQDNNPLFQVKQNGDTVIAGVLTVNGDGTSTFAGNVAIGGSITVAENATVTADFTANTMTVTGDLMVDGNSNLGNDAGDVTTVTGSLTVSEDASFSSNVTIGGDLVVNGTTTTVNSTVTTLNDPVITLANNTTVDDNQDRGVEFKWSNGTVRTGFFGFDDSTGYFTFIPDATNTSEVFTGTPGDIQAGNFRGNLIGGTVEATTGTFSGDVAVNGGDITTTATTASIYDTTATTVNAFRAATALTIGATTGTMTLRNATVVGANATQNLFNTVATTMNFAGASTSLTIGANTGTATIRNPTLVGTQTTQNVYNTVATTVNAFGAATSLTIGAATGTATIRNASVVLDGDLTVNGGDIILGGTGRIQGIDTVTAPTDAASKDYVDTAVANSAGNAIETTVDTSVPTAATPTAVFSFPAATYRSAKIVVQGSHATAGYQVVESLLIHDGTDVFYNEYAELFTGAGTLFSLSATVTGGNVVVSATTTNANTDIKVLAVAKIAV